VDDVRREGSADAYVQDVVSALGRHREFREIPEAYDLGDVGRTASQVLLEIAEGLAELDPLVGGLGAPSGVLAETGAGLARQPGAGGPPTAADPGGQTDDQAQGGQPGA